ncbi:MAG TPA: hypothetical protein VGX68_20060 [Thermoanaerobaculia bacterium]|jgi:hypothetical protein|nr:hypothetical protein [Thermoanaerobaculia bacterium]
MHPLAHVALPAIILTSALGALVMCLLVFKYGFPPAWEATRRTAPGEADQRLVVTRLGHATAGVCFAVTAMLAVVALAQQSRASVPAPASARADAEIDRLWSDVRVLDERVGRTESRVAAAESIGGAADRRVADVASRVSVAEALLREASADAGRALAGLKQLERAAAARASALVAPRRPLPVARPEPSPSAASPRLSRTLPPGLAAGPSMDGRALPAAETPRTGERRSPTAFSRAADPPPAAAEPTPRQEDLADKVRRGWQVVKRDSKAAAEDVLNVFRKVRDWLSP